MTQSGLAGLEAAFLSDLHLTDPRERNSETLLRFLSSLEGHPEPERMNLVLLGDIFDVWVSGHQVFQRRWGSLLSTLEGLRSRGFRIVYFEGNHDMHLAPYWRDVLGAEIHTGPALLEIGEWRIRCEHGDEINRDDLSYLKLRALLRSSTVEFLAHHLPGKFWDTFGRAWSKESRKYSSKEREAHQEKMIRIIREHAIHLWDQDPFDLMVSGHVHVRDDWTFERNGRRVRSVNLGTWLDEPVVLLLGKGGLEWRNLP